MEKRALLLSLLILLLCLSGVALAEEEQPADPASLLLGGQTLTGEERETLGALLTRLLDGQEEE